MSKTMKQVLYMLNKANQYLKEACVLLDTVDDSIVTAKLDREDICARVRTEYKTGSLILSDYRVVATLSDSVYKVFKEDTEELQIVKVAPYYDDLRREDILNSEKVNRMFLDDEAIVGVKYIKEDANGCYGFSKYIPGENLHDILILKHNLSRKERLDYMIQACEIVERLHSKGMLHCDLKPSNFVVDMQNKLYLIDLDMCVPIGEVNKVPRGTKKFAAPELYVKNSQLVPQTDIYSLGIMYKNLLGSCVDKRILSKATAEDCKDRYCNLKDMIKDLKRSV